MRPVGACVGKMLYTAECHLLLAALFCPIAMLGSRSHTQGVHGMLAGTMQAVHVVGASAARRKKGEMGIGCMCAVHAAGTRPNYGQACWFASGTMQWLLACSRRWRFYSGAATSWQCLAVWQGGGSGQCEHVAALQLRRGHPRRSCIRLCGELLCRQLCDADCSCCKVHSSQAETYMCMHMACAGALV